jgi:hypothetical protein
MTKSEMKKIRAERDRLTEQGCSALGWNHAGEFCHRVVYLEEQNDASGAVHPARLLIRESRLRKRSERSGSISSARASE